VGGACGRHGRVEKHVEDFWWESRKEKDHLENHGEYGTMGSKWTLR
jgi:hypothetical protein